ncbi:PC-Esterase domain-containing protein/PMR5N domain-containing protein [Cephalotus follicularis]|uniref:PC-Esterase domain-containing protein/PMR5N domain-containing protein n=1 Tax=Cephalotus follicularis TaxID=3775 RepID=A0A1Q3B1W8_CEPFO|nr:PC-Esterase domain-containing protein/PMR5N domain-containing protein [Cephalotus follicularis]
MNIYKAMDSSKHHAVSDQNLSPRVKLVSGWFSYCVGTTVFVLTVLLLSNSLKPPPVVSPLFQRFYSATASSTTVVSWPLSLENTHLGNFTDNARNGSFSVEVNLNSKDTNITSHGNANVTENNNLIGQLGGSFGGKGRAIEANNGGHLAEPMSNNNDSQVINGGSLQNCDIFDGKWVRDSSKPYYPAGSCPYIDRDFDCNLNGRPDDEFVKWKWQPNGCLLPSLNATDFLEKLRGKKLVFVGDSLNRNMWESLVCILHHSVGNKKRVNEISGRTEFKKKGFYAFRFEDYNCTVDFVGAPFLVRESTFNGRNESYETLRLDLMDRTTSMYEDADVLVFNTGHWWTHEKTSRGEYYYQEDNYVHPRLKVLVAYKRALTTWARWVDKNIVSDRTQVFFRGYSVTHFRGGQWNSGGQCHKETEPIFNDTFLAKYPSKMRALEHVLKEIKTPVTYLNISRLTDYRKDGHPSIYRMKYRTREERNTADRSQDCSHWCLPGVPDTWNELLYASLLKAGRGSWRN